MIETRTTDPAVATGPVPPVRADRTYTIFMLVRTTEAPPVIGDGADAMRREVGELVVPHGGAQRPAVDEDHGPARTPVLVVELSPVLSLDERHVPHSLQLWVVGLIKVFARFGS